MIRKPLDKPHLILASASPRRAKLLREAGYTFEVVAPGLHEPEDLSHHVPPEARAEALSFFKARDVMNAGATGLILAADTIVALGGEVFGKPLDAAHARRILKTLMDTSHEVVTGVTLLDTRSGWRLIDYDRTAVTMKPMSDETLDKYVASGDWMGKAGAYGIQDENDPGIEAIDGSYTNVVGLPMELLESMLWQWNDRAAADSPTEVNAT